MRAMMSVEPPAGNGTMKRIGRLGQSSADPAVGHAMTSAAVAINKVLIARQLNIECFPFWVVECLVYVVFSSIFRFYLQLLCQGRTRPACGIAGALAI
jgi:hypothetical protein